MGMSMYGAHTSRFIDFCLKNSQLQLIYILRNGKEHVYCSILMRVDLRLTNIIGDRALKHPVISLSFLKIYFSVRTTLYFTLITFSVSASELNFEKW